MDTVTLRRIADLAASLDMRFDAFVTCRSMDDEDEDNEELYKEPDFLDPFDAPPRFCDGPPEKVHRSGAN
jgi:hypothetical protein